MKAGPTLCDTLFRASHRNQPNAGWPDNSLWRTALQRAKRFVLDDEMSTFLGELGTQAFATPHKWSDVIERDEALRLQAVRNRKVEHLRMAARLPSEVTWIEYNLRNCQSRSNEILERPFDPTQTPKTEGWLLMRHPHLETAFTAVVVSHDPDIDHGDGHNIWTFPVALAWTVDQDTILPWTQIPFNEESKNAPSEVSTGLIGYRTDRCGFVFSKFVTTPPNKSRAISNLLAEWSGVQRRMWALLATINDLPVQVTEVRPAKGFVARGSYKKFLEHRTLTLTVPQKLYRKTIRDALAIAHRKGGPVREHWRLDWRRPLSPLCDHDWGADEKHMFCNICKGRKIWINEHVRGDTSRGFVTHDFVVTHDPAA